MTSLESLTKPVFRRSEPALKDPTKPRTQKQLVISNKTVSVIFELEREELFRFQSKVMEKLNTLLELNNIPQASPQFLKTHQNILYGLGSQSLFSFLWNFKKEIRTLS
jgi:hypothetical protein